MKFNYLQMMILYCLYTLKGERTTSSVLHLLNGKKSSQTIQDAHLFRLTNLFQTVPSLSREELADIVQLFVEEKFIQMRMTNCYVVTEKGEEELTTFLKVQPIPKYLQGWQYHQVTGIAWKRLSLLVQVCSHLANHHLSYLPVQRQNETKLWVKHFLRTTEYKRSELAEKLLQELLQCLSETDEIDPRTFVLRLTGYKKIGLTSTQAINKLQMDASAYVFQFMNVLHYLIMASSTNPNKYPILSELSKHASKTLTNSTRKTYELVNKGYQLDEIMEIRQLKKGTIEDHLVEIVLTDEQFEIAPFIDEQRKQTILQVANEITTRQLKTIKEHVPEASYFEIRLVLAKHGDQQWN